MADEVNDTQVVDEPVQDSVDTSTNDAQDTDTELEDIEIDLDDVSEDETDETESTEESANESDDQQSEEDEAEEEQSEPVQEDNTSDEERKRHNAEMAQKRIAEREARRQELQNAQAEFLNEAEDAKDLALKQLQVDAYNNRVEFNRNKLETSLDKAIATIDLFKSGSDEQKEYLAQSLDEFERMFVQYDQWGNPVEVKGNLELFLQERADTARRLAGVGARNQNRAKSNEKTRTITPPSTAPKEPKVDEDLKDFDEAWG